MIDELAVQDLRARINGGVLTPVDEAYSSEVAAHNTSIRHTPDVVVAATGIDDVAQAVLFARAQNLRVSVQSTGHTYDPITSGVLISTRRLNTVHVNPISRSVVLGAGAVWATVISEAAKYGLAPVAGSSPGVGVVGYLLGGGLGPLARSHGFSSDYVTGFTLVIGTGEVVKADDTQHEDLFWALRGGKVGLGVVTEVRMRLVPLKSVYAGSLLFDEPHIETALRSWVAWTHTAHPMLTTSAAIICFPDDSDIPELTRGKRVLSLRSAFPGEPAFGAQLAAPLRAFAPAMADTIAVMPASQVSRIHDDPPNAAPSWITGMLLDHANDDLATAWLSQFGAGSHSPFVVAELRHIGSSTASDVSNGTAVAGRSASYTVGAIAVDEALFADRMPDEARGLSHTLQPWRAKEGNPNFMGQCHSYAEFMQTWSKPMQAKIESIRHRYDATGLFMPTYLA